MPVSAKSDLALSWSVSFFLTSYALEKPYFTRSICNTKRSSNS